jgi:hypothetical protein
MGEKKRSDVAARARSGGRRSAWWWAGAGTAIVVALIVIIVVVNRDGSAPKPDANAMTIDSPAATTAVGVESMPPWPAPADATAAARNAGLPMLSSEGNVEHIHVHLDVLNDGQLVPVPANIGIDIARGAISPLHTHDDTGVVHIESPVKRQFSLGEFFSEWGVSLSANNIGGLRATGDKRVRVYVNGQPRAGDPAAIMFNQHDEIALLYGTPKPGETIPTKYDFPPGD